MAENLTYLDKDKNAADGSPSKQWRDVDANEIKTKFNANASTLEGKVDKVTGKGLSTNDYSNEDSQKVSDIRGFAELLLSDNGSNIEIDRSFLSSDFEEILFSNQSDGVVRIESDSISQGSVVVFVQLSDYGFSKYSISGSTIQIEVVEKGGVDLTNTPLDNASILIKLL